MLSKYYKKYIRIPPNESLDIRKIMPLIHHPLFQRLLHISQLGTTLAVFPGAMHNRFEHALGVYGKTVNFCQKMAQGGFLTKHEAVNVSLFGLLHDIGHGPFSHVIEELTPIDHDHNGLKIIISLTNEIKQAGGDPVFIRNLFNRRNNLYRIVMDKNIGMDKLDYLERDIYHTGFGQRPDIESILNYLVFLRGKLVVDKKSLEAAKQIQRLYIYMYKEVYLHKSSLIAGRFLQKMMTIWLELDKVDPSDLWLMNDAELLAKIYTHFDKRLQFLYACYKNRIFPRTGLVIRLKDRELKERIAGKAIRVMGEDRQFFKKFLNYSRPEDLGKIESEIASKLKVLPHKIVVVPTLTPERFAPEDIMYHDDGRIFSLKKTQKQYFKTLESEMSDYMAVRICIIGNRSVVYNNSALIYELIKKKL